LLHNNGNEVDVRHARFVITCLGHWLGTSTKHVFHQIWWRNATVSYAAI